MKTFNPSFHPSIKKTAVFLSLAVLVSGCSGMQKLETENADLKKQVSELEQVKKDYSDQLSATQRLSEQEKSQLRSEMAQLRADLTAKLDKQIQEKEALVQKVNDLTVITLGESVLFGSGIADLTPSGADVISKIAASLNDYPGYHVRIEGHSDDKPIGKNLKDKFTSNWELSTARATAVVRYMIYGLNIDPQRLSAAGYAQYRPTADNSTKEGRAQNRRVEFRIFK